MNAQTTEKRLVQAGRKTRDALRVIRDLVRRERKENPYDLVFSQLDEAVEHATDGLIEISKVFEEILDATQQPYAFEGDINNLHTLQESLTTMKAEREELLGNLQDAQIQLQKYADDVQKLYTIEREKRAELAVAYERLAQADRLKSDFLSTINHELSSPLVPIDLLLQIIEKDALTEEQKKSLAEAKKLLVQYKRQLDGVIKYANLINQSHIIVPKPIDLKTLLNDTLAPLALLAKGRNITINVEPVPPELTLKADPDLVSGALYQLVHNAVKFNRPGGHVEIDVQDQRGGVLFRIKDDGPGIPDAIMERLGQDFNQIVEALRRGVEGLGLGLALANYVANAHNGRLTAVHGAESGTLVEFWLPAQSD